MVPQANLGSSLDPLGQLAPDLLKPPKSQLEPARILEILDLWPVLQPAAWTWLSPEPACSELTTRPRRRLWAIYGNSSTRQSAAPGEGVCTACFPWRGHEVIVLNPSRKKRLGLGVPLQERSWPTGVGLKASGFKLSGPPGSRVPLLSDLQKRSQTLNLGSV